MKTALERYLDRTCKKVIQTYSANWCGDDVWIVYSEDIVNSVDGIYIHKYDNQNYVLVHRSESSEYGTITKDLYYYTEYEDSIRKLVSIETIREYIWNLCKHTHNEKDFEDLKGFSLEEMYETIKGI